MKSQYKKLELDKVIELLKNEFKEKLKNTKKYLYSPIICIMQQKYKTKQEFENNANISGKLLKDIWNNFKRRNSGTYYLYEN